MLDELRVSNLALIESAHVEPGPGFVVVTGETGTGKTLLLGALRLLLGEAARQDQVGPAGDLIEVEGRFLLNGHEVVAARRVGGGRSRAYLDGAMVPAKELAATMAGLVEIVGQHDHVSLATTKGVRRLLDAALDDEGRDALARYRDAFARLRELKDMQKTLGGDRRALERELDIVRFQADEIAAAGFEEGDDVHLAESANRLRNAEGIAEGLGEALAALTDEDGGAEAALGAAVRRLERVARLDPTLESLVEQAREALSAVGEVVLDATSLADSLEHDPRGLEQTESRLALLNDLRRKYGDDLGDILRFGNAATARATELTALLDRADGLAEDIAKATAAVTEAGARLRLARVETGARLAGRATGHLRQLGFAAPVVEFAVEEAAPGPDGIDAVRLQFASDTSLPPGPVGRIASGGELSRLVLALRLAAGVADVPIVAFDEIDAGVGGATALAMGEKLASLAEGRQVFCVTHLPQVAAFADSHYVVKRSGSSTEVHRVAGEARLEELSRMLSGLPESEKGKDHAAELLALATGT